MRRQIFGFVAFALSFTGSALVHAEGLDQDGLSIAAILDARLIATDRLKSFDDGGYGLTRFGGNAQGDDRVLFRVPTAAILIRQQILSDLSFDTDLRFDAKDRSKLDPIEAVLRYTPVSTGALKGSFRVGAFLPPVALEEDAMGWTSPYTLTPSALVSWIWEEVRIFGAEGTLTWRGQQDRADLILAVFSGNDPIGAQIAQRGFGFTDRISGLFDGRVRGPDQGFAASYVNEFPEIDNQAGLYAGAKFKSEDWGTLSLFGYDNRGDPTIIRNGRVAWETRFAALGWQADLPGALTLITQAMSGMTQIEPSPFFTLKARFDTAYALLSRDFGVHRLSLRAETFRVSDLHRNRGVDMDQRGHAVTAAYITWPFDNMRLTLESLYVSSIEGRRAIAGQSPRSDELQLQCGLRYYFR
jgi:hypothetical protein